MRDDNGSLLVAFFARVHAILGTESDDQLGQLLQHICGIVFIQALATSISGEVNGNERGGLAQRRRFEDVSPDCPAIGESVNEDDQRSVRVDGFRGVGLVIGNEVKLESALQGQHVVRETLKVLR